VNFFYKLKKFLGNWTVLDQVAVSGGNFLLVAICAQRLSASNQGVLIYVISIYFFVLFLNISMYMSGASVLSAKKSSDENHIYFNVLAKMQIISGFLTSTLMLFLIIFLNDLYKWTLGSYEIIAIYMFLFFQQLSDYYRRSAYIFFEVKKAAISSFLIYVPRVLFLFLFLEDDPDVVYITMAITAIFPALYLAFLVFKNNIKIRSYTANLIEHIFFSRLLVVSAILSWVWSYLPLFFLGHFKGNESVAVVGSIRSLVNFANVFLEQLEISVAAHLPRVFVNESKSKLKKVVTKLISIGSTVWLIGMLAIYFYGSEILESILGVYYGQYENAFIFLWCSILAYFISRVVSIYARSMLNKRVEFVGGVTSVIVGLLGSPFLIIEYGINGAALSFVMIFIFSALAQLIYMRFCLMIKQ